MEAVGVPSSVNRTQGERKLALRTLGCLFWRLRRFQHNVRLGISGTEVMGQCAWNITMTWSIRIYLFHHRQGDLRASWGIRTVTCADPRSAATALTIRYNLYLVWDGILGAFCVSIGSRHLAIAGLIIDALHTGDGNR